MNRYTFIIVQTESNVKLACILPLRNRKSRLDALISRREALLPSSRNMQVLGCKPIRKHTISVTYLGSYNLQWRANVEGNTAVIHVTVTNSSTMQSATRPPYVGYWSAWQNSVGKLINESFSTGWGSKTTQTFNLTETVKL